MQLRTYAKYTSFMNVEQDETDRSYAVCKKDDNKVDDKLIKNARITVFLVFTILLPMIFVVISAACVRSFHRGIHRIIARKSSHHNLTGLALTGMIVTFYVLGCDITAISIAALNNNEISQDTFDFATLIFLTVYSIFSFALPGMILLYMCCKHVSEYISRGAVGNGPGVDNEEGNRKGNEGSS